MSKKKLIEALKEAHDVDATGFSDSDLGDWLDDTVEVKYLPRDEEQIIAAVGERFFRYHQHHAVGIIWDTLEEVEPYDQTITRYRPK